MLAKRLRLAKRLLKPDGVLVVTIDEHEVHHLGVLLEQECGEFARQMVTIVINEKGVAQGRLSRVEEHAIFCFGGSAAIPPQEDDFLSPIEGKSSGSKHRVGSGYFVAEPTHAGRTERSSFFRSTSIRRFRRLKASVNRYHSRSSLRFLRTELWHGRFAGTDRSATGE